MAGNIFVISDPHFGHHNVIKFANRPFTNVEEMEESIVDLWNKTVDKRDTVLILGDWGWGVKALKVIDRLLGYKRLIIGNHDVADPNILAKYFGSVHGSFQKENILFTHIPIMMDRFHNYEWIVHGHIHNSYDNIKDYRYYNANMDAQKYYGPIPLEEIKSTLRLRKVDAMLNGEQ